MTEKTGERTVFLLFLVSGFCSLLYQVIWIRLAFASFGIITPVLSVVISVFMAGLAAGSWFGGKWIRGFSGRLGLPAVHFYAFAEFLIGIGAFVVPLLFTAGEGILLSFGDADSLRYLLASAAFISAAIFPWCVCMGFTFPFMMAWLRQQEGGQTRSFSFLYLGNVIGAMAGTLITAFVLIEMVGFRTTLLIAAVANFCIGAAAWYLGRTMPLDKGTIGYGQHLPHQQTERQPDAGIIFTILFLTGLVSMGLEVIWTRAFTPVFGTTIYSFASILAVYLFATWLGSFWYRRQARSGSVMSTPVLSGLVALTAFLPVLLTDPRLQGGIPIVVISIFPFCAVLGYLTPKLIDEYSGGIAEYAGAAYAANILGCIIGPLAASYLLLPVLSIRLAMVFLALPGLLLFLFFFIRMERRPLQAYLSALALSVFLFLSVFPATSYEELYGKKYRSSMIRRDHTATVIAAGEGFGKRLYVNGVGITKLTQITKNMAHLPLLFLERKPESALVICFGMGTTFRSLLSWEIEATAVELVPGVRDVFPYFFSDAEALLRNPRGTIVIDDGRRFLNRTTRMFDVVTIDPPPPVEAAGSSLLYSEEFYRIIRSHLKEGGLLQQWFPVGEKRILQAIARSLVNSFPHVRAFLSVEGRGVHFIASGLPMRTPSPAEIHARMPESAKGDLMEWSAGQDFSGATASMLGREIDTARLLNSDPAVAITDDRPYNEYFFLRRTADRIRGEVTETL